MSGYSIVTLDIARPIDPVRLPDDAQGLAIDVRCEGRPVGFLMRAARGGEEIATERLRGWIAEEIGAADREQTAAVASDAGAMPFVTIAICTKDHPDLLERCLRAIGGLRSGHPDDRHEVLVIDNASIDDRTRHVVAAHPGVRYVLEERTGLNFARNRALAEAHGEILAFIDDDAVVDPGWLSGLRDAWARCPDAGGFSGQTLPFELETPAQILVEKLGGFRKGFQPIVHGRDPVSDPLYPCSTVFGNGCNMAFRVDVMRALGGFDEALDTGRPLPGGGDLDALYSVVRSGRALVYEPRMLVRHQHRRDMAGLSRQIRRSWGAGCMAFLVKIRDHDPEMSAKARVFIRWWVLDLARRLKPWADRGEQPWGLVAQEFIGALVGLTGTYERSRRRSARIRSAVDGHAG